MPVATMPGPLRWIADHQPFTPVVETMRGLWMGHTSTGAASWLFRHRTAG